MKNPWTKKNPLMSLWLSGANAVAGSVRGRASAEAKRQATAMMNRGTKQMAGFWTDILTPQTPSGKRRKAR